MNNYFILTNYRIHFEFFVLKLNKGKLIPLLYYNDSNISNCKIN